jgi:hypothetical protein
MNPINIGTEYITYRGKGKNREAVLNTVIDIYKTYNNAGDLVYTRYVSKHAFLNQYITSYEITDTEILRAIWNEEHKAN